ncbi:4-hydroxythreonine-4-phosphate dehydrogenase [Leptospira ryugenii]|uniref:4-hydroxythreonine-4-phosphate dehydrogenase n=1 Tax=Leptospira ryugenii TaxID=1917863 RepID=A0A2P2DYT4_9LEPT|nr:4-hydroxythreonine-4-phosphate dehydrogenase PdxA [Leptospira ryugenii]GBF49785.1 4-hydroxythreonine-4-phosphate dehydrogenase [Leptospira ryugenii]
MKTILISEGDPTGINYELLSRALVPLQKAAKSHRILLVRGDHNQRLKSFQTVSEIPQSPGLYAYTYPSVSASEDKQVRLGKPSEVSGRISYSSLILSVELQKKIPNSHLITLPLSKEWVIRSGVKDFRGHTEALALAYQRPTFMMMTGKRLFVIPLTTHIPLKDVVEELKKVNTKELILAISKSHLLKKPKIGILGLNPHAGESGKIGNEEEEILRPMMHSFASAGFSIEGPLSADSAFLPTAKKYDLYLANYHDQGLIPFKMIEGKAGVNVTLGLDFIRVSPDHGTAFDIAGKKKADPTSLLTCLRLLVSLK